MYLSNKFPKSIVILSNEKYRGVRILLSEGSIKMVAKNPEQEEAEEEEDIRQKVKVNLTSPYSVVRDKGGNWEDPSRPSLGYTPGMGAGDLLAKANH